MKPTARRFARERVMALRLWSDDDGSWRASIKDLATREVRYFGSVEALVAFFDEVLESLGDEKTSGE